MRRPVCALLVLVAGSCGEIRDEEDPNGRPLELPYLTAAIFAPTCGQTQCHSTFKRQGGLVFDHPDSVRRSLLRQGNDALLSFTSDKYDPRPIETTDVPDLIVWVTEIDPFGNGIGRMPFDAPLADRDIQLLGLWIREDKDPVTRAPRVGGNAVGAQCNPELYDGLACNLNELVLCGEDWNFAESQQICDRGCEIVQPAGSATYVARCRVPTPP